MQILLTKLFYYHVHVLKEQGIMCRYEMAKQSVSAKASRKTQQSQERLHLKTPVEW